MNSIEKLIEELCPEGVSKIPISEIGNLRRGKRFVKADMVSHGIPCIHYGQIYTRYGLEASETISFLEHEVAKNLRKAKPGELLIVSAGETVEDIGKPVVWRGDESVVFHDAVYALDTDMNPKYVAHFLLTNDFRSQAAKYISSSKVSAISTQNLGKVFLPVPPLEIQKEIVEILDDFTQLEAELEAELEARKKQYEALRSMYLDFDLESNVNPLSEKIKELCPEGVRIEILGDVTKNNDSKRRPVTRSERVPGSIPYYGANGVQDFVRDHIFDGVFLLIGEDGSVLQSNGGPVLNWAEGKIWVNNHAHVLSEISNEFSLRFIFYFLSTVDVSTYVTGGTQKKLNQSNLNRIPVPIPPIEIQNEIVEILDNLESMTASLSSGLPAEIAARKKQYDYYRDKLLTFKELKSA